jgi:hypothetical protein
MERPRNIGSTWNNRLAVNPLVRGSNPRQGATLRASPSKPLRDCLDSDLLIYGAGLDTPSPLVYSPPCRVGAFLRSGGAS